MKISLSLRQKWHTLIFPAILLGAVLSANAGSDSRDSLPEKVEFNRDIRPILSDTCFKCHGPDENLRKGKLRLDQEESVLAKREGYHILFPGNPNKSELWQRITSKVRRERMPPSREKRQLNERQIALIKRWIEQGAKWEKHWAFIPPRRPELPKVKQNDWPRNGIDHFILARLEKEGLKPSPEADRRTLIRRVSLDLTGIPPTLGEVHAFLADKSPDAYEKVVDRLLSSNRYGERMALPWLDAARYADTNGYQADGKRIMWRWRDWVIDAFNKNMPYNQFTIEQLAGDLLPNATLEQKIATGFNRNHRGNAEGGIIPEEYKVEYVVDRVDTTFTVWLGLTMGCARCHDHKYDPISQREFYQVFAYFNNIPERGKVVRFGNSPPFIKSPTPAQHAVIKKVKQRIAAAEKELEEKKDLLQLTEDLIKLELSQPETKKKAIDWIITKGLQAQFPFDSNLVNQFGKKGQAKFVRGEPDFAKGKLEQAVVLDGKSHINAGNMGDFNYFDRISLGIWIYPTENSGVIVSRMQKNDRSEGYSLVLENGHLHFNLVKRWLDDAIRLRTRKKLQPGRWYHVLATYDGTRVAKGINLYVNGKPQELQIILNELNQDFKTKAPLLIGAGNFVRRFQGKIDDLRVYSKCLSPEEAGVVATTEPLDKILFTPQKDRSAHQQEKIRQYILNERGPDKIKNLWEKIQSLKDYLFLLDKQIPTTMIMKENETPAKTHLLIRGQYNKKGEVVQRDVPHCLPGLPNGGENNRLKFARWVVSPENPLTARVAVNRFWQMYFGKGLVKTTEDFGAQGDWPSHPQLLDWLATEFMRTGWNVKAMQKLIVTSAAYRQSSQVTPERLKKDPQNRLLSRGPRVRLSAHAIRDQALFLSGLLKEKIGGPSVKPYQPPGLWKDLSGRKYIRDKGDKLYRRSLYIFWKRTSPPPAMMTFDTGSRESCLVRQSRTNTPLQALNLMNDVAYVEAARNFAQRMILEGGNPPEKRIRYAFEMATSRLPTKAEMDILADGLEAYLNKYRKDKKAAVKLIRVGESVPDSRIEASELAGYTALASVIMNLDEVITKQ